MTDRTRPAIAVTVGTFDGVHVGHRLLLSEAGRIAEDAGLALVAVTLDRHPLSLLRPERAPRLLTGLAHKLELLASEGIARTRVLAFDQERASQSAESFVTETLVGELNVRLVVVGENFRFGSRGVGDTDLLERVGARFGLEVVSVPLLETAPGVAVSSSHVRGLVATGRLDEAERLLLRPHEVRGHLVAREGLTAHDQMKDPAGRDVVSVPEELLLPPPGTYHVLAGPVGEGPVAALATVVSSASPGEPATVTLSQPGPGDVFLAGSTDRSVRAFSVAFISLEVAVARAGSTGDRAGAPAAGSVSPRAAGPAGDR